jgi:hypothetical protein
MFGCQGNIAKSAKILPQAAILSPCKVEFGENIADGARF